MNVFKFTARILLLWSVYSACKTSPSLREWFRGVVLVLLLAIGCVELNPGPRSNEEINGPRNRRQYGSIESRQGRYEGQEDIPPRLSVCWPFMFWCKNEPLPDEERLLGRQSTRRHPTLQFRDDSEDDELLQVDSKPPDKKKKGQESDANLAIDLLKQQIEHLNMQLEREVKQRKEERKCYEDTITQYRQTQEQARRLHEDLYGKLDEEKKHLEQQLEQMKREKEYMIAEETSRIEAGNKAQLERELEHQKLLQTQLDQIKLEREQSIEDIKTMYTDLKEKLNQETEQKKLLEEQVEHFRCEKEKSKNEAERICKELQEKLVIEISEKRVLAQQIETLKQNSKLYNTDDQVGKLNKEFQRRKQLEKELEKQIIEQKKLTANFQEETEKRQQLEQQLRLQTLDLESARREFEDLNQEQEIQRRQLQHALDLEKIKHLEVSQQLDNEVKQKQELSRKLLKETEERHKVELRLQQEIQARQEIELDLKAQILEQHEPGHSFTPHEDDNIEIISDSAETQSVSEDVSVLESDTVSKDDEIEEAEEAQLIDENNDSNINDEDDEKQEIRQLLMEEFQRLQTQSRKEKNSAENSDLTDNENAADPEISTQGFFLDGVNETNMNEVERHMSMSGSEIHEMNDDGSPDFYFQDEESEVFVQSDIISRGNQYLTMTMIPKDELDSPSPRRKGVLLKKSETPQLAYTEKGEDCVDFPRAPKQTKLINFQHSDIHEEIVTFQGKDVTLGSLLGERIYPQMVPVLKQIRDLSKEGIKPAIGRPYAKEGYCIPRKYFRKIYVKPEIFKHKSSRLPTVFAVSGMTKLELEELIPPEERINQRSSSGIDNAGWRFILLRENFAESDYRDLCEMTRNFKAIHWLEKKEDGLIWKQSKGNTDVIREYIDPEKIENVSSILSIEDRIIVLTGNNGDGKTVCLRNLTNDLKDMNPSSWVIRINGNELLSQTEKHNLTKDYVLEFLLSTVITGSNSSIDRLLFQHSLEITGNVILLLDEINFKLRDKIQCLFDILKTMRMKKLVIAAHKRVQECLENILSTFALNLKPLDKEELQNLLVRMWIPKNKNVDTEMYMKFAILLLSSIEKPLNSSFSLTPQHISMLAFIFGKELSEFLTSHTISLPNYLNIFEVHETFIEMQCDLYCSACSNVNRNNLKCKFYKELTSTAILSMFSGNQMDHVINDFLKKFTEELKEIKCEIMNQFSFLHGDLQDYIVAKWFTENYQEYRQMIEQIYFEPDFQSMWEIFDYLLAKGNEIHTAVLNKDTEKLRDIILSGSDQSSLDMVGRSALHLASIQGKYQLENDSDGISKCVEIVSVLLNHKIDVSIKDSFLNWTALSYADRVGCWPIIEELLKTGSDVDDMIFTNTKLHNSLFLQEILTEAAVNGYLYLTAFILDAGVDINMPLHSSRYSHQQYSLIHIAAENSHMTLLKFLLDHGAKVNNGNWDDNTPLHLACRQGKIESVKILIERGANVSSTNKIGETCLHEAVRGGHIDIVGILMRNHADVNAYNKYGETPFHIACRGNTLQSVSYLLEGNIDNTIRNKNGDSPLECAILEGHTALAKYVLGKSRQCLTVRNKDNRHPLHLAAMRGDVLILDYLLEVTPEVDVMTLGGDTPLHLASLHSKADAAVFLLKKGANVNKSNNYGNTALHLSSLRGNINVMRVLLEYHADINARNVEGNTPLHLASLQGKENALCYLVSHGSDVNIKNREKNSPLQLAVEKGYLHIIKLLIEAGSDVNAIDRYGNSTLHQAVCKGREDIVKALTDTGQCNPDVKDAKGESPLLIATRSGLTNIIETLIKAGADINFATDDGNAPLHIATVMGNLEIMKLLIESGANLEIKNHLGNTPLHRAAYLKNQTVIEFLVNHGANKKIQNAKGDTAFDIGVQIGCSDDVLQIL